TASNALELLFPKAPAAASRIGNRVFVLDGDSIETLRSGLEAPPLALAPAQWEHVLRSHLLDPASLTLLAEDEVEAFLARREASIEAATQRILMQVTGHGFEDTPPLDDLDLDDLDDAQLPLL